MHRIYYKFDMSIVNEAYTWRDIVSSVPEEREVYDPNSLAGYIDAIVEYYRELSAGVNLDNDETASQILGDVIDLFAEYCERFGSIEKIYIAGNGFYSPEETTEIGFFDGSHGIMGEFEGFTIETQPLYQDLLYRTDGNYRIQPTLCIQLKNYQTFSDTGIALESTGEIVTIPLEHQDLSYRRDHDLVVW